VCGNKVSNHTWSLNNAPFNQANCAYWLESPRGTFNAKMADFIIDILRLSAENGIYVLISPFDTFFYDNYLPRTAWHTSQGGPLTDINHFYTNPDVLAMAKTRWSWVINTINNSGYGDAVFAYEILNEWDSFEWTRPNIDANKDAQIRQKFITELAAHVRSLDDEHLLVSSSTALDPRGALGHGFLIKNH
jgi:mannan endo-1,4-beta-mannosidase